MTLRERVLETLTAAYPDTLTNRQIANRIGANEPSVRVVTKQLDDKGLVFAYDGGYSNVPVQWKLTNEPVVATASVGDVAPAGTVTLPEGL
jgi:DNA-binding Lrp family transcriptional regulator